MCLLLCSVLWPAGLPTVIPMEEVALVLLSKLYFLQNRKVNLYKHFQPLIRKTITVCACALLRRVSTRLRFTGLTCPTQGYATVLLPSTYCNRAY